MIIQFESPESSEQKNARFAEGKMTEKEISGHLADSSHPLFEHKTLLKDAGKEQEFKFAVRALNEEYTPRLLRELEASWDKGAFLELKSTLEKYFEQKKIAHPTLTQVEYYIATDKDDNPFAMTGIYTQDIYGPGLATKNKYDLTKNHMIAKLGWFAVSKEYQGSRVGSFLFDWVEKMAKNRGANMMVIETDDYENEERARQLYEKRGYSPGLDIKNYYGPGRDLHMLYCNLPEIENREIGETPSVTEKVDPSNQKEILELAKKIYSSDKYASFEICLDLFLQQKEGEAQISHPLSLVTRDSDGKIESFSIMAVSYAKNSMFSTWNGARDDVPGAKERLIQKMKRFAQDTDKGVLIVSQDEDDDTFLKNGFIRPADGIPEVYERGDPTKFLLYSKKL